MALCLGRLQDELPFFLCHSCAWFPLVAAFQEGWRWRVVVASCFSCGGRTLISYHHPLDSVFSWYCIWPNFLDFESQAAVESQKELKPSCHTFLHHFALTRVTNMTKSFWDAINMKYEWCSSSVPINHLLFVDAGFQIIRWMQNAAFHNPSRPFSLLILMLVFHGMEGRV